MKRPKRGGAHRLSRTPKSPSSKKSHRLTLREQHARILGLAAINRVRKGESKTLSTAARAEGTTVATIHRLLPATLYKRGSRLLVKSGDPYSARVEIMTDRGPQIVSARGSKQRELAGLHRAAVIKILRGTEPPSGLRKFRSKKVGGRKLLSDPNLLATLAQADALGQLDALYASPEVQS